MTKKFQHLGRFFPHLIGAAAMVLAVLATGDARAAWPERTVTIIVPFPPGGPMICSAGCWPPSWRRNWGRASLSRTASVRSAILGLPRRARRARRLHPRVVTVVVLINPGVAKVAHDPKRTWGRKNASLQ